MSRLNVSKLSLPNIVRLATVHGYGQIVTVLNQVALIPLLIKYWGSSGYGHWITLTSIAALTALLDFGISRAAVDRVSVLIGQNKKFEALYLFKYLICIYGLIYACSLILASLVILVFKISSFNTDVLIAAILIFEYAIRMMDSVLHAGYRIKEKTAKHWFLYYSCALIQFGAIAIMVTFGNEILMVAIVLFLIRAAFFIYAICALNIKNTHRIFTRRLRHHIAIKLKKESRANFFQTIGLVLNQYGLNLLISFFLPAKSLAVFAIYRTAGRVASQVVQVVFNSLDHEIGKSSSMAKINQFIYSKRTLYVIFSVLVVFPPFLYYAIAQMAGARIESNLIVCICVVLASILEASFFLIFYSNRVFGKHALMAGGYLKLTFLQLIAIGLSLLIYPTIEIASVIYLLCWMWLFFYYWINFSKKNPKFKT